MQLNYVKVNPSQNMTIFVKDPLPREEYPRIAMRLMDYSSLHGEQVGFIEEPRLAGGALGRLQMMGGEFCANASRAFAVYLAMRHFPESPAVTVPIEVSGSEEMIPIEVTKISRGIYDAALTVKEAYTTEDETFYFRNLNVYGTWVHLEGIDHLIVMKEEMKCPEDFFRELVKSMADQEYEALGLMVYEPAREFLDPYVYVKATESLVHERSCGSGTIAVGIYKAHTQGKSIDLTLFQPGGYLKIQGDYKGRLEKITLSGPIEIVSEGVVNVNY